MAADVAFTFDPSSIVNGVNSVNKRMSDMTKSFSQSAKNLTKSVTKGILKATVVIGGLVAAFKGVRNAIRTHMPEIGEAFKIAKETFFKNFFWPIRKELMPLLQRMLDWVRDNRAQFLKWGQTVVNIFKTVITIAKQMVQWARTMFEQITTSIERLFGDQVKSLQEALDLLAFKASAVAIFLGLVAQQVVDWFSQIIERWGAPLLQLFEDLFVKSGLINTAWQLFRSIIDGLIGIGAGFLSGLAERGAEVGENLNQIFENIRRIWTAWTTPTASGNSLVTVARTLAGLISDIFEEVTSLIAAFTGGFAEGARNLMDPMQAVADAFREIFNLVFGGEGLENFFKNLGRWLGESLTGALKRLANFLEEIAEAIRKIKEFMAGEITVKSALQTVSDALLPEALEAGKPGATAEEFFGRLLGLRTFTLPGGENRVVRERQVPQFLAENPEAQVFGREGAENTLAMARLIADLQGRGIDTSQIHVSVTIPGMTLVVTEGNAEAAGANFGMGLGSTIADEFDANKRAAGE